MLFPERLRQLRTQSGMKQREVAHALGVDIPMYSRYEHGERRPKREQVVKIAKIFQADPNELVAMWLAFSALNEIGTDRLAHLALHYLRQELDQDMPDDAPAPLPVEESAPVVGDDYGSLFDNLTDEQPPVQSADNEQPAIQEEEPEPVQRTLVAQLADNPFPLFVEGALIEVIDQIEDNSIDCVLTSLPLDRADRADAKVMSHVKRILKPGGSMMLNKAGHDMSENTCRRFLEAACEDGGIVLDLHCDTGLVCKTAFDMKLRSIGISNDAEAIRQAHKLVQQTPLSLF